MNDEYYSKYIDELHKRYETDPVSAVNLLSDSINRLKPRKIVLNEKQINIILMVLITALTVFSTFICAESLSMQIFGSIFFFAGLFIGLYIPGFGLIFLLSHGLTGLYLMNQDIFSKLVDNPVLSDPSSYMTKYLSITSIVLICAFIATVAHNIFVKKVREIKYIRPIILLLWLAGLVLFRLIPYRMGISELFPFFH